MSKVLEKKEDKSKEENIVERKRKLEKIEKKKKLRKRIIIVAVIVLFAWVFIFSKPKATGKMEFNYEEVTADVGNIDVVVDGKGVIKPNSQYDIFANVTGEILVDNVEVGKSVNKDDLLYVIDSEDVAVNIDRAKLAVKQSELNYNNVERQVSDLKIIANADGIVENLAISKGSFVNNSMEICKIADVDKYEIKLQFLYSSVENMSVGDKAEIDFLDYLTKINGTVKYIGDEKIMLSTGSQVVEVTIEASTAGYSVSGAKANAKVSMKNGKEVRSVNTNYFTKISLNSVRAKTNGIVENVLVENGSSVKTGDVIAILSSTDLDNTYKQAGISLNDAKLSLSNVQKQLDNYRIASPITGKVVYKNSKLGDNLSIYSVTNSNVMATIADTSIMKFEMDVDELDISKVKVGQKVKITIEALDNKEYEGVVSNINTIGKNVSGITTYSVTIEMEGKDEIYSGMNVDADIEISSVENAIRVPLGAIRRGNVAYVKVDDVNYQDEDANVPMGYKKVVVEIGENNNEYIEVLSGIKEGDVLLVDKIKQSGIFNMQGMMRHGM